MGEDNIVNGTITALDSNNLRGLVNAAKKLQIQKDDIVSILKEGDRFVMIYYEYGRK